MKTLGMYMDNTQPKLRAAGPQRSVTHPYPHPTHPIIQL